jgi:hypothetical protein
MLNFFKKRRIKHIQDWEYDLLRSIAVKLPKKYSFLSAQIDPEFLLDSVLNELLNEGWKRTILNQNLYNNYKNTSINYQMKGILVYDVLESKNKEVQLDLYEGILIGYRVPTGKFDLERIDLANLKEVGFVTPTEELKYRELFNGKNSDYLDLNDGFEIQLDNKNYYTIKDLGDGNYISIDSSGKVYGMFHDPYLVELIHGDVQEFIDQVNAGKFSIDDYRDSKLN